METLVKSEEIHNKITTLSEQFHFDIEQHEKVLMEVKSTDKDVYLQKLKNIGFKNDIVLKWEEQNQQLEKDKFLTTEIRKVISYYKNVFTHQTILSVVDMINICEKYGLIFGKIEQFNEMVPEKNLSEMENFIKMLENFNGKSFLPDTNWINGSMNMNKTNDLHIYKGTNSFFKVDENVLNEKSNGSHEIISGLSGNKFNFHKNGLNLYVTAPKNNFRLNKNQSIIGTCITTDKNFSVEHQQRKLELERRVVLDPIVWAHVKFPLIGGACIIITKWGEEASFPEFLNPIEN